MTDPKKPKNKKTRKTSPAVEKAKQLRKLYSRRVTLSTKIETAQATIEPARKELADVNAEIAKLEAPAEPVVRDGAS